MSSICLSICLSVMLVNQDHIPVGWKSWKLSAQTISQHLQSSYPKGHPPILWGTQGNFKKTRGGVGKSGVLEHKSGSISETHKESPRKLLWRAYRNSPMLLCMVPFPTPYILPFPRLEVGNPHPKLQSLLSQEWVKLRTSNMAGIFTGSI